MTAKFVGAGEELPHQPPAKACAAIGCRDTDLVDPHLGSLVRVHIMNARGHADDLSSSNRYRQMVPRVLDELVAPTWFDRVIEDSRGNLVEERGIRGIEHAKADLYHPALASWRHPTTSTKDRAAAR